MVDFKPIDLSYLDVMSDGDDDMKKTMLEMLMDEIPGELEKMQSLQAEKDWDNLGKVSHKMKSTLAFVGNVAMTENNQMLELNCKKLENLEQNGALVSIIVDNYNHVAPELQSALEEL